MSKHKKYASTLRAHKHNTSKAEYVQNIRDVCPHITLAAMLLPYSCCCSGVHCRLYLDCQNSCFQYYIEEMVFEYPSTLSVKHWCWMLFEWYSDWEFCRWRSSLWSVWHRNLYKISLDFANRRRIIVHFMYGYLSIWVRLWRSVVMATKDHSSLFDS